MVEWLRTKTKKGSYVYERAWQTLKSKKTLRECYKRPSELKQKVWSNLIQEYGVVYINSYNNHMFTAFAYRKIPCSNTEFYVYYITKSHTYMLDGTVDLRYVQWRNK